MATPNPVPKLYRTVVEDVISNVREAFLDESVDEQVLQELKQLWESKLLQSKAVEGMPSEQDNLLSGAYAQLQQQQQPVAPIQATTLPVTFTSPLELGGMSSAAQAATLALQGGLLPQQIAALQAGGGITLQQGQGGTHHLVIQQAPGGAPVTVQAQPLDTQMQRQGNATTYAITQPVTVAVNTQSQQNRTVQQVTQLDGAHDTSSEEEEESDNDENDDDNDEEKDDEENEYQGEEEEPLNSGDDVSDEDPSELFDTENVVVCQYDKINRSKNKWKFHLKDGIMNLDGKDYVFQKANGDAEW